MSTEKQIEANRKNSEHSTGPVSEEGKEISSRNAEKHGLCSKSLREFEQERKLEILTEIRFEKGLANFLEGRLANLLVRMERCQSAEFEVLHFHTIEGFGSLAASYMRAVSSDMLEKIARYERSIESSIIRTINTIKALESEEDETTR